MHFLASLSSFFNPLDTTDNLKERIGLKPAIKRKYEMRF